MIYLTRWEVNIERWIRNSEPEGGRNPGRTSC
jgi:hypothetical protein